MAVLEAKTYLEALTGMTTLEKLKTATAGSHELDALVRDAVGYSDVGSSLPYTTSVDAALMLVEEKLPGICILWQITPERTIVNFSTKGLGSVESRWFPQVDARTPALALCIAIIDAIVNYPDPKEVLPTFLINSGMTGIRWFPIRLLLVIILFPFYVIGAAAWNAGKTLLEMLDFLINGSP